MVSNGCSSSKKHVYITASKEETKGTLQKNRRLLKRKADICSIHFRQLCAQLGTRSSVGNMLGNSWQPPESHNLPLFHRKAGCVFPGTVPPVALNYSLFVPMPFLFLDISPILQRDARTAVRERLGTKPSLWPPGTPWPLGPAVCHSSAHLCPALRPAPAKTPLLTPPS